MNEFNDSVNFNYIIEQVRLLKKAVSLPYMCDNCKSMMEYHIEQLEKTLGEITHVSN